MQFQGIAPVAFIPSMTRTLIPFGIIILLGGLPIQVRQRARATNRNIVVGNSGVTTTGVQTASPVNVNA